MIVAVLVGALACTLVAPADGPPPARVSTAETGGPTEKEGETGETGEAARDESDGTPRADEDPDAAAERARASFERAVAAAAAQDFDTAAAAFEASDRAIASQAAAYNAAFAHEKAGAWVAAARRYDEYLRRYPDGDWRGEVEGALGRVSAHVARLAIEVVGAGEPVEVWVDETRVEVGEPVVYAPGRVEVEVRTLTGTALESRAIDVYPGSVATVRIELLVAPVPTPEPSTTTADTSNDPPPGSGDDPGESGVRRTPARWTAPAAIVGGVATGAAAVGLGVAGGLALDARARFYDARCPNPCQDGSYPFAEEDQFERARLAANVLVGATVALAIGTTAIIVVHARGRSRGARARLRLEPSGTLRF